MYIYGGFSYDCATACADLWKFEIPYAPIKLYPEKENAWHNMGNHWTELSKNEIYGPGPRWRMSMVAMQRFKDKFNENEEHFLYIFGGIKILTEEALKSRKDYDVNFRSSYVFMNDMWRYDLVSDQWEDLEAQGI